MRIVRTECDIVLENEEQAEIICRKWLDQGYYDPFLGNKGRFYSMQTELDTDLDVGLRLCVVDKNIYQNYDSIWTESLKQLRTNNYGRRPYSLSKIIIVNDLTISTCKWSVGFNFNEIKGPSSPIVQFQMLTTFKNNEELWIKPNHELETVTTN